MSGHGEGEHDRFSKCLSLSRLFLLGGYGIFLFIYLISKGPLLFSFSSPPLEKEIREEKTERGNSYHFIPASLKEASSYFGFFDGLAAEKWIEKEKEGTVLGQSCAEIVSPRDCFFFREMIDDVLRSYSKKFPTESKKAIVIESRCLPCLSGLFDLSESVSFDVVFREANLAQHLNIFPLNEIRETIDEKELERKLRETKVVIFLPHSLRSFQEQALRESLENVAILDFFIVKKDFEERGEDWQSRVFDIILKN